MITDPTLHIEAERLIVPTLPGAYGSPPAWACQFLRERALKHVRPSATPRRFLISRNRPGLTRSITNEDELFAALQPWGFDRLFPEDLTLVDEISLFNNAEMIVGAAGSGMVNAMWCSPGTIVIELFNSSYVNVMIWAMADLLGLKYGYVVDPGRDTGRLGRGV